MNEAHMNITTSQTLRALALLTLLVPLLFIANGSVAEAKQKLPVAQRQAIFDRVWTTVRDKHYDPKLNGLNWTDVRKRYLPKALKASSDAEFYTTLNQMLGELKQSHLGVFPPDSATSSDNSAGDKSGQTGIQALLSGDKVVVTEVEEKSGAAEANIVPGMTLVSINGKPVEESLKKLKGRKPAMREGELRVYVWSAIRSLLSGPVGTKVTVVARSGSDAEKTFEVSRKPAVGQIITFGALPPLPARVETKTLDGGIGYIRFNIFLIPLLDDIRKALARFTADKAPGVIIDLRGNPGGIGVMACSVTGMTIPTQTSLGMMKTRTTELRFPVFPQAPQYKGPIAVLTDESSLSTSEILAAGLRELKRAVVVGRTTGGMVLPSQIEVLPGGGEFQYVFADFHTPRGVRLEGTGVVPDIPVDLSPETLLNHPDPVIQAAVAYINKQIPASP